MDSLFYLVFIPVLVWLVAVIILFYFLLRHYTFKKWETPNPYQAETFAMPRGIFRGILTLSLLFLVMLMEVVSLKINNIEAHIDNLLVAFQMMLAFYFGSKVMHHVTKADERKTKQRAGMLSETLKTEGLPGDAEAVG